MKLVLFCYGTRGDVQPFIALGMGLLDAGFEVTLAAPENFEEVVAGYGLSYARLAGDFQALISSEEGQRYLRSGNTVRFLANQKKLLDELAPAIRRDLAVAGRGADGIIADLVLTYESSCLADALEVPLLRVALVPWVPRTGDFAHPLVTIRNLSRPLNRLSFDLAEELWWLSRRAHILAWRRELGLPTGRIRIEHADPLMPIVHAYSRHVVPRPPDLGEGNIVSGFLQLPEDGSAPPEDLAQWLEQGEAPVFLGFGSIPIRDTEVVLAMAEAVARELAVRVVVGAGWSDFRGSAARGPVEVFVAGPVDHRWLFPRCRCVVHHGGAGTLATGLQAGIPTVVCSVFSDQPFWGKRVEALGVGEHFPLRQLTAQRLTEAVRNALSEDVKARAVALGERLRAENGVAVAVETAKAFFLPPR